MGQHAFEVSGGSRQQAQGFDAALVYHTCVVEASVPNDDLQVRALGSQPDVQLKACASRQRQDICRNFSIGQAPKNQRKTLTGGHL
jgi:hypothetical protein